MPPLTTASVADQTVDVLEHAIVTGQLEPGERYTAEGIASLLDLQVSRTPVREALLRLSEAGYVVVEPKRGFRVIKRNAHDIEELFQLRLMLEVPATYVAAHPSAMMNLTKLRAEFDVMANIAQFAEKRPRNNTTEAPDPSSQELDLKFVQADTRFHERILKAAGNKRLVHDVRKLRSGITALGAWRLSQARIGGLIQVQREHKALLTAISRHDQAAAATAMYKHLVKTGSELMLQLEREGQGTYNREWFKSVFVPPQA